MRWLVILLLLSACTSPLVQERQEDIHQQQEVIRQLESENRVLRQVNSILRKDVVRYAENLSRTEEIVNVCVENYPALRNHALDDISPETHVPLNDILITQAKVLINIPNVKEGIVAASKSMEPYLDENDVVLEIMPSDPAHIHEEDIIIFQRGNDRIIHRVIEIGYDEQGMVCTDKRR
jgi:hypothetical protein